MRLLFKRLLLLTVCLLPLQSALAESPRVITSDWATAETLVTMGYPPIGLGDKRMYQNWVKTPPMPEQTLDVGLRFQPNLERLYQIKPDMFIQTDWFTHLKPQFAQIAPVYEVAFANAEGIDYAILVSGTRKVGEIINAKTAAEQLITQTNTQLAEQKSMLVPFNNRPLAIVQFVDARHLRIYGQTSLYQATLNELGLENAWNGESNKWGFANIALADLAKLPPETLLIIVKPHPLGLRSDLEKSLLWQSLPFSKSENYRVFEPSWSYGALPSIQRFAEQLATKLPGQEDAVW